MKGKRKTHGIGLALAATVLLVASSAFALSAPGAGTPVGPGMMNGAAGSGGFGPGMMSGAVGATGFGPGMMMGGRVAAGPTSATTVKPTGAQLAHVRDRIDSWLAASGFDGFKVAEVMAFTNNDYAAVHDAAGNPAFELLTGRTAGWVMEEPPSMMWNTRYGMMGDLGGRVSPMMGGGMMGGGWNGWYGSGAGRVASTGQAVAVANRWLARAHPGEQVAADAGTPMAKYPGYFTFDTTRSGKTVGMLSVNATTGVVWYHGWHGAFLAEQDF